MYIHIFARKYKINSILIVNKDVLQITLQYKHHTVIFVKYEIVFKTIFIKIWEKSIRKFFQFKLSIYLDFIKILHP